MDDLVAGPNGRHLYVVSSRAIAVFSRDPATGGLTQAPGPAGCVAVDGAEDCGTARAFDSKTPLAGKQRFTLSPDGRYAYLFTRARAKNPNEVPDNTAVLGFARDPASGSLTQLPDTAGCVTAAPHGGCANARLADIGSLVITPDGRHLYASSPLDDPALTVFTRDPQTGALTEIRGRAGCLSVARRPDCRLLRGITSASRVAVSPNGRHLYTNGGNETIAAFSRDAATGELTQLRGSAGCLSGEARGGSCVGIRGLSWSEALALAPDGRNVYTSGTMSASLVAFIRNRRSGRLLQLPGRAGCVGSGDRDQREFGETLGCSDGRLLDFVIDLAVSRNGKRLYALDFGYGAVLTFTRRQRAK